MVFSEPHMFENIDGRRQVTYFVIDLKYFSPCLCPNFSYILETFSIYVFSSIFTVILRTRAWVVYISTPTQHLKS